MSDESSLGAFDIKHCYFDCGYCFNFTVEKTLRNDYKQYGSGVFFPSQKCLIQSTIRVAHFITITKYKHAV